MYLYVPTVYNIKYTFYNKIDFNNIKCQSKMFNKLNEIIC